MTLPNTIGVIFAVIALGFALFAHFADSDWSRKIGRYGFLLCVFIGVVAIETLPGYSWLLGLVIGMIGIILLFLWIDVLTPLFKFIMKRIGKR